MTVNHSFDPTPDVRKTAIDIRIQYGSGQITFEAAIEKLNELLKDSKKRRHLADQITVHNIIGILYSLQGKLADSLNSYRQALHLAKILNHQNQASIINMNMGEIYRRKGDFKEALKLYTLAHSMSKELKEWSAVPAGSLINIGETFYQMGQYAEAREKLLEAIHLVEITWPEENIQRPFAFGEAYAYLGHIYIEMGEPNAAKDAAAKAMSYADGSKDNQRLGLIHRLYGELYSRYPELSPETNPDDHFNKAIELFKEINVATELGRTYLMQAESRHKRGLLEGADQCYREAMTIFGRLGMAVQVSVALEARARLNLEKH